MTNMWEKIDEDGRRRKGRPKQRWMDTLDSIYVDLLGRDRCMEEMLGEGTVALRRCITRLCGGNLSDTLTPHRSGKMWWKNKIT